jgi:hypothetical protein
MTTSRYFYKFIVKHSLHRSLSQAIQYVMKCDSTTSMILTVNRFNWCKVETARNDVLNVDGCIHSDVFTKFNKAECAFRLCSRRETTRDVLCTSTYTYTYIYIYTYTYTYTYTYIYIYIYIYIYLLSCLLSGLCVVASRRRRLYWSFVQNLFITLNKPLTPSSLGRWISVMWSQNSTTHDKIFTFSRARQFILSCVSSIQSPNARASSLRHNLILSFLLCLSVQVAFPLHFSQLCLLSFTSVYGWLSAYPASFVWWRKRKSV